MAEPSAGFQAMAKLAAIPPPKVVLMVTSILPLMVPASSLTLPEPATDWPKTLIEPLGLKVQSAASVYLRPMVTVLPPMEIVPVPTNAWPEAHDTLRSDTETPSRERVPTTLTAKLPSVDADPSMLRPVPFGPPAEATAID